MPVKNVFFCPKITSNTLKPNYGLFIFSFFFIIIVFGMFDIEALFDISDINIVSIISVVVALIAIYNDSLIKLDYTSGLKKDIIVYIYMYSYSVNLLYYFFIIWFVFFSHILVPLNSYNYDNSFDITKYCLNYLGLILISFFFFVVLMSLCIILVKSEFNIYVTYFFYFLFFIFFLNIIFCGFLIIFSQLNSFSLSNKTNIWTNTYNTTKTTISYPVLKNTLTFDWHDINNKVHNINFVQLYSLFGYFLFFFYLFITSVLNLLSILHSLSLNTISVIKTNLNNVFIKFFVLFIFVLLNLIYVYLFNGLI